LNRKVRRGSRGGRRRRNPLGIHLTTVMLGLVEFVRDIGVAVVGVVVKRRSLLFEGMV